MADRNSPLVARVVIDPTPVSEFQIEQWGEAVQDAKAVLVGVPSKPAPPKRKRANRNAIKLLEATR